MSVFFIEIILSIIVLASGGPLFYIIVTYIINRVKNTTSKNIQYKNKVFAIFELINCSKDKNLFIKDFGYFKQSGKFVSLEIDLPEYIYGFGDGPALELSVNDISDVFIDKNYYRLFFIVFAFVDSNNNKYKIKVSKKELLLLKKNTKIS